jgi:hypothetical protein
MARNGLVCNSTFLAILNFSIFPPNKNMTTPRRQPRWTQVTNAERQAIWETLLYRSNNGKLAHGQYTAVGRLCGVNYRVVQRIWERGISTMRTRTAAVVKSRANKRGRSKKDRAARC